MALAAIPEAAPFRFGTVSLSESADEPQNKDNQVALSVKHTFIEMVAAPKLQRSRSYTDTDVPASSPATKPADDKEGRRELSDEASTDVASDAESPVDTSPAMPSMPVEWASPCWGPAGDLYYANVPTDEFILPAAEIVQTELPLDDGYSWSMMAADDPSWGLNSDGFSWGMHCSNAAAEMPADQWQAYTGMEGWYDPQQDFTNAEGGMENYSYGMAEASMAAAACMYSEDTSQHISGDTMATPSSTSNQGSDAAKTTIMLWNLPNHYKRSDLIEILEDEGFEGSYDLVYVPMDFTCQCCLGYAFVNFLSASDAARCWTVFDGFSDWGADGDMLCEVMWSHPHQGVEALIERYRNSPVMHDSVPDEWKPAFFVDGVRTTFPEPTEKIKAPKQKARSAKAKKDKP